jgi:hypothetical protein
MSVPPWAVSILPGERSLFVAKEFALEKVFRNGRAIDGHKAPRPAVGRLVQPAGQNLFARAALAQQHHRGARVGHLLDGAADAQHVGVARDQTSQCVGMAHGLQPRVFGLKLVQPERPFDREIEHLGLEGFGQKIVGAHGNGLERVGLSVLPGEHDHLGVGSRANDLLQQAETLFCSVRVGRQAQVHRDDRRCVTTQLGQCTLAIVRSCGRELVKRPFDLFLQRQIVFHDQQLRAFVCAHASPN